MTAFSQSLLQAYQETSYVVFDGRQELVIRVGERCPDVERLIAEHGCRSATFITAYNPYSHALSEAENRSRQDLLRSRVRDSGWRFLSGEGRGSCGDWPYEPSLLVFGPNRQQSEELGRSAQQNAIVYISSGFPAELILLRLVDG